MRKGKEKNGRVINTGSEAELFLEDVKAQIQYKPAAERAGKELYAHMEDKAEDYRREGMPVEEAMDQAVKDMGDASALGVMLNQTHQVRVPSMFVLAVILAVLAGLAGNFLEYCSRKYCSQPGQWGEQLILAAGMSLYFPVGLIIFWITFRKGYPWIIRFSGLFLTGAGGGLVMVALMSGLRVYGVDLFRYFGINTASMLSMPVIVLSVPVLLVLAYKLRNRKERGILLSMGLFGVSFLFFCRMDGRSLNMNYKMISFAAFMLPMFYLAVRGCFRIPVKKAILLILVPGILIAGVWTLDNGRILKDYIRQCFFPREEARSSWDDAYNSILIKELLPQARPFGEIELSQNKLEEYYTSEWYFNGNWDSELPMRTLSTKRSQNNKIELTDILPQHYHNNYRIAFWILKYGWVPGLLMLGGVLMLYLFMFRLVRDIHNPLGKTVSLSCALFLAMQAVLYAAGNFGFQFAWFPAFPFLSEGLASISTNMVLAGMIASAYSYDHAVEEEEELKAFRPLDRRDTPQAE